MKTHAAPAAVLSASKTPASTPTPAQTVTAGYREAIRRVVQNAAQTEVAQRPQAGNADGQGRYRVADALTRIQEARRLATADPRDVARATAILDEVYAWLSALVTPENIDRHYADGIGRTHAMQLAGAAASAVITMRRKLRLGAMSDAAWTYGINSFRAGAEICQVLGDERKVADSPASGVLENASDYLLLTGGLLVAAAGVVVIGAAGAPLVVAEAELFAGAVVRAGRTVLGIVLALPINNPAGAVALAEFAVGTTLSLATGGGIRSYLAQLRTPEGLAWTLFEVMQLRMQMQTPSGRPRVVAVEGQGGFDTTSGRLRFKVTRAPLVPEPKAIEAPAAAAAAPRKGAPPGAPTEPPAAPTASVRGAGAMAALKYEPGHPGALQPLDPRGVLNGSVPIGDARGTRVGVDYARWTFVVFTPVQGKPGVYSGAVLEWDELRPVQRTALVDAAMADRGGRILAGPPVPALAPIVRRGAEGRIMITTEIGPPDPRRGYESELYRGVEVGLAGWQRAHSQGAGLGAERPEGIRYAPPQVNQELQNHGIEAFLRRLYRQRPPGIRLLLTTETQAHPGTLRLKGINYRLDAVKENERVRVFEASIEVENARDNPRVSVSVTNELLGP